MRTARGGRWQATQVGARAAEQFRTFEFAGWLARQPPEARVAAALAEVELEAVVVAFAMGGAQEP